MPYPWNRDEELEAAELNAAVAWAATGPFFPGFGQGAVTATLPTLTLNPNRLSSILVTVATNTTIDVLPGAVGQVLRLEIKQDAIGGRSVGLGPSVVFGADLPSYAPSTAPNTRDLLQLIYAGTSAWMLVAVSHGFGV